MDNVENLQQDAGIALILQRLKDAKSPVKSDTPPEDTVTQDDKTTPSMIISAPEIPVASLPKKVIDRKEDPEVVEEIAEKDLSEEPILPWFLKSDKDQKMLHYITFDDAGNLVYNTVKSDHPANDLASLKLRDNYACDIDYYKSRHFVLCVKQFESDYSFSRSFSKLDESKHRVSEANDSNPALVKTPTEDISLLVSDADKYWHYVVFTDLGVADFIVRQDDISYPFGESNLSKWFEEASNHSMLKNTEYYANPLVTSDAVNLIRDHRYDIITMHIPGVITLDSVDNDDPDYQVHIKLKDRYRFIPLNRVLKCLRYYATHDDKTFDNFKQFVNQYFDVIV